MKGRKPTPPALKLLRGNPGKRPVKGKNLKPAVEKLEPPFFLRGDGLGEWNRLEPELRRLGILTTLDYGIFMAYCSAYGDFCETERLVQEVGLILETPSGVQRIHPIVTARNEAARAMVKFAVELGITPASRSRVTPVDVGGGEVNPFSLINGGKEDSDDGLAPV